MDTTASLTYSQWLNTLNDLVLDRVGESLYQLPELPYAAAYERELTPDEFFDTIVCDHLDRSHTATR